MNRGEQLEAIRSEFFAATTRYAWREDLGSGGMGVVFRAFDTELGEDVAIKVLVRAEGGDGAESLARFKREISLSRKIRHPNVARVHDLGLAGGHIFLTMEYVRGYTLAEVLEASGRLSPSEAVGYLRQIALGVGSAHGIGIIHRDLKPQNVIVDDQGAVAILDFGLAYRQSLEPITGGEICIGTPRYMAPEQACADTVDARTDVYAMGVMAFELLTGEVPFAGATPWETARMQVEEPVPGFLLGEAGVPERLSELVLRCLAKQPTSRPASGSELESLLARVALAPTPAQERPPGRPPRTLVLPREEAAVDVRTVPVPGIAAPGEAGSGPVVPESAAPGGEAGPGRAPRVLVADDDTHFLAFARLVLEADGIDVRTAESGEDALHGLHGSPIDLALIDLWMPSADGLDVLRIHRSQNPERPVPTVLVSASVSRAQVAFAVRLGALEVLEKPLTAGLLGSCVRKHLRNLGWTFPD